MRLLTRFYGIQNYIVNVNKFPRESVTETLLYLFVVCRFSVEVTRNDATSRSTKSEPRVSNEGEASQEKGEEGEKKMPMYTFTPVDRYGDNKEQTEPLQDLGIYAHVHVL